MQAKNFNQTFQLTRKEVKMLVEITEKELMLLITLVLALKALLN